MAASITREYEALAASGALPLDEAKKQALARIRALRFGDSGYIVVFDRDKMLMHPFKAELEGMPIAKVLDVNGRAISVEGVKSTLQTGSGFTSFMWVKPVHYKPWAWYFMVGLYVDDLDQAFRQQLREAAIWLAVIGAVLGGMVVLLVRNIERQIGGDPEVAVAVARRIATGDLSVEVAVRAGDRTSLMAAMKSTMQEILADVGRVSSMIGEISAVTREQGIGIEQINQSVAEIDQMTQQNAALVEEAAAASEAMREQAARLAQAVGVFKLEPGAGDGYPGAVGRQPSSLLVVDRASAASHEKAKRSHRDGIRA